MRQTMTFEEVSIRSEKSGKCSTCGKRRKRSKTFWQTLNPFNKHGDGTIKTRFDIETELRTKANEWRNEPIDCCNE